MLYYVIYMQFTSVNVNGEVLTDAVDVGDLLTCLGLILWVEVTDWL